MKKYLKKRLLSQGIHPKVVKFVSENHQALIRIETRDNRIYPSFVFAGEYITENQANEMAELRQYLKGEENLAWTFEDTDDYIGPRFKIE